MQWMRGIVIGVLVVPSLLGCRRYCQNGDEVSEDFCSKGCVEEHVERDGVCVLERFVACCECLEESDCLMSSSETECIDAFSDNELPEATSSCFSEKCAKECFAERRGPYKKLRD